MKRCETCGKYALEDGTGLLHLYRMEDGTEFWAHWEHAPEYGTDCCLR